MRGCCAHPHCSPDPAGHRHHVQFANIRNYAGGTKGLAYGEVARCTSSAAAQTGSHLETNSNGKRNTRSAELEVRADPTHAPWTKARLLAERKAAGERDQLKYRLP